MTRPQKLALLTDPVALAELHGRVWTSPEAHRSWPAPMLRPSTVPVTIRCARRRR